MRLSKRRASTTLFSGADCRRACFPIGKAGGKFRPAVVACLAAILLAQPAWGQVPTWPTAPAASTQPVGPSHDAGGNASSWDPRLAPGNGTVEGGSGRSLGNASWAFGQPSAYGSGNTPADRPERPAAFLSTETVAPEGSAARSSVPLSGNGANHTGTTDGKNAPASQESVLRLPRSGADQEQSGSVVPSGWGPIATTLSALAVVLGIFLIFAWLMRRASGKGAAGLPSELVEILGQVPLNGRQRLCVLRFGRKLVLACVSVDGAETLAELTDPEEVDELLTIWRRNSPASASHAFRKVFAQYAAGEALPKHVG